MDADNLGAWSPLPIEVAHELFRAAPFQWYIAGGHALELALGRTWRTHDDLDVGICRKDLGLLHQHLSDWDLHVAAGGVLAPWDGHPLSQDRDENNIWARRSAAHPWAFDVIVSGGDRDLWWSRRDPSIRLPWAEAIEYAADTPYLAPHAQLLMKAKTIRPKDDLDAEAVIPVLRGPQRSWLAEHLPPDHAWHRILRQSSLNE